MFVPTSRVMPGVIKELKRQKLDRERNGLPFKLAVSFVGGGARGAYEAGAIEGLLDLLRKPPHDAQDRQDPDVPGLTLSPNIIVGTSAGAYVASGLFMDCLYGDIPRAPGLYTCLQSNTWQEICSKNNASEKIGSDRAWVLGVASRKQPLPLIDGIRGEINKLQGVVDLLTKDVREIRRKWDALGQEIGKLTRAFENLSPDVDTRVRPVLEATFGVIDEVNGIITDVQNLLPVSLTETPRKITNLDARIGRLLQRIDPFQGAPVALQKLQDLLAALDNAIPDVDEAGRQLLRSIADLIDDTQSATGNLEQVIVLTRSLLVEVGRLEELLGWTLIEIDGKPSVTEHMFEVTGLRRIWRQFLVGAYRGGTERPPQDMPISEAIIADWTNKGPGNRPELFLVSTNLSASRLNVFTIAEQQTVEELANVVWTIDLTARVGPTDKILHPLLDRDSDPNLIGDATITCGAYPYAFPAQTWQLLRIGASGMPEQMTQKLLDGGVSGNVPVEIALAAGATHIISIELQPLAEPPVVVKDVRRDDGFSRGLALYNADRQGIRRQSINAVFLAGTLMYRLAPIQPEQDGQGNPITPGLLDFDGVYDSGNQLVMGLYDWFMQGYIDARGIDTKSADTKTKALFNDYDQSTGSSHRGHLGNAAFMGNRYWSTADHPWP